MPKIIYKSVMDPIPIEKFLTQTGLNLKQIDFGQWEKVARVVAPRDLKKVITVNIMSTEYLQTILSAITLLGNPDKKVYANTQIKLVDIDPNMLFTGQRFVYRDHYTAIMENVCQLFKGFTVPQGISQWTPYLIIGLDKNHEFVLAHYLPPIIEKHGHIFILLDGIHRCFIARQAGTNIKSIVIMPFIFP